MLFEYTVIPHPDCHNAMDAYRVGDAMPVPFSDECWRDCTIVAINGYVLTLRVDIGVV